MSIRRRALLGTGLAAAALPFAAPFARLEAAAPMIGRGAPAWYRFRFGEYEVTVVSDGHLPLGRAEDSFVGAAPGEVNAMMRAALLDPANALLEQNAVIVNTGRHLVLFDTGMGDSMGPASQMFGPTTGRLLRNMRAAGIEPAQIDATFRMPRWRSPRPTCATGRMTPTSAAPPSWSPSSAARRRTSRLIATAW